MSRHNLRLMCLVGGALTLAACSSSSPVGPSSAAGPAELASSSAHAGGTGGVAGIYELSFLDTRGNVVTTLPVLTEELVLKAHVADLLGNPAQGGSVTFQYCSYRGLPPNDITRADEAPMEACATGTASWRNLLSSPVDQFGNPGMNFGFVRIPRTVGFRFTFKKGSSNVASDIGGPADFVWTAA